MVNGNCAVIGCTNSRFKIKAWQKKECSEHKGLWHKDCPCPTPFSLHIFPSVKLNSDKRKEWIRLLRGTTKGHKEWTPGQSDMVCSMHFVDGRPTLENPNPTLNLGYDKPAKKPRRELVRAAPPVMTPRSSSPATEASSSYSATSEITSTVQDLCGSSAFPKDEECQKCLEISSLMDSKVSVIKMENYALKENIAKLSKKLESLKLKKDDVKGPQRMSAAFLKSDEQIKFYTGIQSLVIFNAIFALFRPYLPNLVLWRGSKTIISTKARPTGNKGLMSQKLCGKDQFLLVMMRLRLGLLLNDLACRFEISPSTCSRIFSTWMRFLSRILGDALIVWLEKDIITTNLPDVFKGPYSKTRCIIDCTEIAIERP
ncbi:uncharacterized protein LOC135687672 [Rhopilema esculentum]|uniref:uncharacterized protein LOC135687672 n=1 Tax=Rhopilema esculentum TaxID=499914 RepID=UPI0031D78B4C